MIDHEPTDETLTKIETIVRIVIGIILGLATISCFVLGGIYPPF